LATFSFFIFSGLTEADASRSIFLRFNVWPFFILLSVSSLLNLTFGDFYVLESPDVIDGSINLFLSLLNDLFLSTMLLVLLSFGFARLFLLIFGLSTILWDHSILLYKFLFFSGDFIPGVA